MNQEADLSSPRFNSETVSANCESARTIVAQVLRDRGHGHPVTDAEILATYPQLNDALKVELKLAAQMRQALLIARHELAGQSHLRSSTAPVSPSAALTPLEDVQPRMIGYLINGEISRGGQAVVYEAIQESTGRRVAIKMMSGGPFVASRHRQRFEREARILAKLSHSNIVSILERGQTSFGSFYFVMPYIDGQALDEYWTQYCARDKEGTCKLVQLFVKIARAVEEAHTQEIIHRDLKPSNIRVDRRGEPHVLDFGLARPIENSRDIAGRTITVPGQIMGSLHWLSPEQAAGSSVSLTAQSDVYSLGIILYQCVTGNFPHTFDGTIDQVLISIRTSKAKAPSKHPYSRPGVDQRLDAIILKALSKLPADRYDSAVGLAKDLEAWLNSKPTLAKLPKPVYRRSAFALTTFAFITASFVFAVLSRKISQTTEPVVFQLPTITNSIGMRLEKIPPGRFMMGSPANESGRTDDEYQRQASIDHSFYLATTETTQSEYQKVMNDNPTVVAWRGAAMPVCNVSWVEANEFCRRLTLVEHVHYRLPTEIEYEYACRAQSISPYPNPSHPELSTWSLENSGGVPHPVATKAPNAWGLYDMQGNVQEWCENIHYTDGTVDHGHLPHISQRSLRGGSALSDFGCCRAASRSFAAELAHQPDFGFRVVQDR